MISGTGSKKRTIKASDIAINSPFSFNKSINPRGGSLSSIFISRTKNDLGMVKLYQDPNDDGLITRKEMIYKGKTGSQINDDKLLNFFGDIKLSKTMHKCDWLLLKNSNANIACTREFIPTVYDLTLVAESGDNYSLEAVGRFASPELFKPIIA